MKLILIDGGPASGKNTLGTLMVQEFMKQRNDAILLNLDTYVEKFNPSWVWQDEQKKELDQQNARVNLAKDVSKYLKKNYVVITIGERFLTKEDIASFIKRLEIVSPIYLYHLRIPFSIRMKRLHERGPHSLIDLEKDQMDRDLNVKWYGYIYENINSPIEDVKNLMKLIQDNEGVLDLTLFK